jgi:hypothetical protein
VSRTLLLAALLPILALAWPSPTTAQQPAAATISGRIYFDADGDGAQDAGEPGLSTRVNLIVIEGDPLAGAPAPARTTDAGDYSFIVAPGTYRVAPELERRVGLCADGPASNNPFSSSLCWSAELPVTSPETSDAITLAAGDIKTLDFGETARDQMVLIVRAIEDDHYARAGDVVTAIVNGNECGSAKVPPDVNGIPGENPFVLYVDGAGETGGCPTAEGQAITFKLNGTESTHTVAYHRYRPR